MKKDRLNDLTVTQIDEKNWGDYNLIQVNIKKMLVNFFLICVNYWG